MRSSATARASAELMLSRAASGCGGGLRLGLDVFERRRETTPVLPGLVVLMGAQGEKDPERGCVGLCRFQLGLRLAQVLQRVPQQVLCEALVCGHVHGRLHWHPDAPRPVAAPAECPLSGAARGGATG
ncbi:hypothetical protein ACRBEV_25900 [Methylobacterium phyllosphaerae]